MPTHARAAAFTYMLECVLASHSTACGRTCVTFSNIHNSFFTWIVLFATLTFVRLCSTQRWEWHWTHCRHKTRSPALPFSLVFILKMMIIFAPSFDPFVFFTMRTSVCLCSTKRWERCWRHSRYKTRTAVMLLYTYECRACLHTHTLPHSHIC